MKKIKILIADDHEVVRSGLRTYFESMPNMTVVGEAADGAEAIEMVAGSLPDVAVIDISMPNVNGLEAAKMIKMRHPEVKILILTIHDDEEFVLQMVATGVDGYVLKDADKKEIIEAVQKVASGERFFSPRISQILIGEFIKTIEGEKNPSASTSKKLTPREREVLRCVAQGLTNQEIAGVLYISPLTVHTHRNNLMQKLDIHDTAGLVRYAIEMGLLTSK